MKFIVASILLMALIAVAMGKPTEVESLEPTKTESASHQEQIAEAGPRDKRGVIFGAYTAPVAYTAAYTAPVAYTSAYSYPYAYSAYSAYPYYAAAYSSPYYLA
ncbi:uncharacterized protein LOC103571068 [Microplitis demolitor]|uniref:uncharacterized protein LOC103571068 n=1 Tax=Microplitis demolitor TaxID=69319 RepID=UPI0004CD2749|nr:uncharacterized protein LOC103571068 [Microplitis demolitor]